MRTKIVKSSELGAEFQERSCKVEDLKEVFIQEEVVTFPGLNVVECKSAAVDFRELIEDSEIKGKTNELCMMLPPIF